MMLVSRQYLNKSVREIHDVLRQNSKAEQNVKAEFHSIDGALSQRPQSAGGPPVEFH